MNYWIYILVNLVVMQLLLSYYAYSSFPFLRNFKVQGASFLTVYIISLLFCLFIVPIVLIVLFVGLVRSFFRKKPKEAVGLDDVDGFLKGGGFV